MACDPKELAELAKCYCYDPKTADQVKIYLLAVTAGLDSVSPEDLAERAKCYCFNPETAKRVQAYLLCQIASG